MNHCQHTKTILILAANPLDTSPLRLDKEAREIDNGLQRAQRREQFDLKQQWAARPMDVRRAMLDYKPKLVHFCGHGEGDAGIAFENNSSDTALVDAEALAGLFALFAEHLECVLLNACYSEVQAEAIAAHIPYVIGMSREISDQAALEFAVAFYDALGAGKNIEFAYKLGCNAIQMSGVPEHLTPILKTKPLAAENPVKKTIPLEAVFQAEKSQRIALFYKRHAEPDEYLLTLLEKHLSAAGHRIFIDRRMNIGVEWARQISEEIRNADAVIPLLSKNSMHSEMLASEVEMAHQAMQEQNGKPRLLPVRIAFEGSLPAELEAVLAPLQYSLWRSQEDDMRLVKELLHSLDHPPPPKKTAQMETVGGAMPLDSKFYLVRPVDEQFHTAIARRDTVVLIKGARQMGKTSLLARGLDQARRQGVQVVLTDFQKLSFAQLQDLESFYLALGELLADQLELDVYPEDTWKPGRNPNTNFERWLRREVLRKKGKLLWAIDEADRLFGCDFGGEVFALFRSWHNERALDPSGPWSRLTLAIAYATEAHLFIKDPNQSPFNIGTRIALSDFDPAQIAELNRRYGSPLRDDAEVQRFHRLTGGHPYLSRRALNDLVEQNHGLDSWADGAALEHSSIGDHLRRMLVLLARDSELQDTLRAVLQNQNCPDYESFYRLRSAGVISGESKEEARVRCELYRLYLEKHL
ncbi:MAG: TIR domain-containing protein [Gammaproteobacteria bacterium]|nr:TIR domain-containing protein [Gammaproteobacteria bacterium]